MPYIKTFDREQMMFCSWDSLVDAQSIARIIDAFVNSLNMADFDIKEAAAEGRPSYDPKGMLKLYIYGSRKGIRSSRKLQESCFINIEVKWMLGGVEPDFRTISEFRKVNINALKKIFKEFNRRISGAVQWGFKSIDGSKFQANNSKDKNYTANKLDDRIKWLNGHTDEYLRILDEMDARESESEGEEADSEGEEADVITREQIENKLADAKERLAKYEGYRRVLEETGVSQLSVTDADAKLMKNKNGFMVAYNPQTVVDSETHLIQDYNMTNQCTDHGMLDASLKDLKAENPDEIIEAVADKGYEDEDDMISCLEHGIIPHVITDDGQDGYELEVAYVEAEADLQSTKPEELSKAIHSGQIPDAYKDVIENIKVKVKRQLVNDEAQLAESEIKSIYGTEEQMRERAVQGYFVRDPERNLVICPAGEVLRQKCIKSNGNIRYANKNACRHCKNRNKCYKGKNEYKEIDFTKDKLEKPCKNWLAAEGKQCDSSAKPKKKSGHFEKVKVVRFFLRPDREKMAQRMCLSEHPFGTIKRTMGATHFLLRGLRKVEGEFALFCLGYNIERAKNLLGFDQLMKMMVIA